MRVGQYDDNANTMGQYFFAKCSDLEDVLGSLYFGVSDQETPEAIVAVRQCGPSSGPTGEWTGYVAMWPLPGQECTGRRACDEMGEICNGGQWEEGNTIVAARAECGSSPCGMPDSSARTDLSRCSA